MVDIAEAEIEVPSSWNSTLSKVLLSYAWSRSDFSKPEIPQCGAADAEIKFPSGENTELKPEVGQYIAVHATLTARDFFLAYFYPSGPFTCIFSKTFPDFSCVGCD